MSSRNQPQEEKHQDMSTPAAVIPLQQRTRARGKLRSMTSLNDAIGEVTTIVGKEISRPVNGRAGRREQKRKESREETSLVVLQPPPPRPKVTLCECCHQPVDEYNHGWIPDYNHFDGYHYTPLVPCPVCSPLVKKNRAERAHREALKSVFGSTDLFATTNFPERSLTWTVKSLPEGADTHALEETLAFVHQEYEEPFFYLFGLSGRCKTGIALASSKEALYQDRSVFYLNAAAYGRYLRQAARMEISPELRNRAQGMIDLAYSASLLIFDDLGMLHRTEFVVGQLYDLFEVRLADPALQTIFTCNYSLHELEQLWRPHGTPEGAFYLGSNIIERLRGFAIGTPVYGPNQHDQEAQAVVPRRQQK
jgi:DNA replication protein DnaC